MSVFINTFLLIYAGLFPIVNPIGNAPLFLSMTRWQSDSTRAQLARRVAVNSTFLLLGSLLVGSHLLVFFGISLPVVRIAGGLVVTAFAWTMLNAGNTPDGDASEKNGVDAFYPLTMPLTVGPGSISVAITLGSQRPGYAGWSDLILMGGAALAGILAIAVSIYLCYRFANRIVAFLGEAGTNVVMRLSAFILLCIGIEILWNGIAALLHLKV
ncbi:MAG: MarC family protein [Alphaproteobacteria bacterium]|jgi:multiple antibiotic resistance protein|nr:MarC family protein [Alphaproteobacteria bacterium]OJY75805.1 MAG: antibiotic resistance protein [Rhodospirillales bacterium 70-18]MBN9556144.1 MarC family protein [Alphaproteobacteria bacterium]MBN9566392.1 MarC family protein [Alphaproteobacteria bacterium]MBN9571655.1 MarC family protein [Alphaproteobacteria bacterium]